MEVSNLSNYSKQSYPGGSAPSNVAFKKVIRVDIDNIKFFNGLDNILKKVNPEYSSTFLDTDDGKIIGIFTNGEDAAWLDKYKTSLRKVLNHFVPTIDNSFDRVAEDSRIRDSFVKNNLSKYVSTGEPISQAQLVEHIKNGKFDFSTFDIKA